MQRMKKLLSISIICMLPNTLMPKNPPIIISDFDASIDLVDITKINPNISLEILYATPNNFTKHVVYSQARCFLRKSVALKLDRLQKELETMGLGLKIWDGYRPFAVQKKFWDLVPDERYVGNPAKGSNHNRGCAVDLTLVDKHGKELLMPTKFDDFSEKAHHGYPDLDAVAITNREKLKNLMVRYGFKPIESEWWHYDDIDSHKYPLLDIPIEKLG